MKEKCNNSGPRHEDCNFSDEILVEIGCYFLYTVLTGTGLYVLQSSGENLVYSVDDSEET